MLSVIMPIYNSVEYLSAAIASVLDGGVDELELIAIDDRSTDGSAELLADLAEKDNRIKPIYTERNLGVSAVRNIGLSLAVGDYVAFCDSDDLVERGAYRLMLELIGDNDLVIGGYLDLTDSGNERRIIPPKKKAGLIEAVFSGSSLWHKLFRREHILKNGLEFDESLSLGEDVVFLSHFALTRPRYLTTEQIVYRYYHHDRAAKASLTHVFSLERLRQHIDCRRMMMELLSPEFPEVRDYVYHHFVDYLDRFLPFVEGREQQAEAFALYRDFMSGYDWQSHPDQFLALTGVEYSRFLEADVYTYLQSKYDILPRDRVYHEFGAGKIGLRWIIKYFIQWLKFKFR